jgi:hypothetical protein
MESLLYESRTLAITVCIVLAALWRYWDGRGGAFFIESLRWKTRYRNLVAGVLALCCAYLGIGLTYWIIPLAGLACLNIIVGRTRWEDLSYNSIRFGLGTALTVGPLIVFQISSGFVTAGAIAYLFSGFAVGAVQHYWTQWSKMPVWIMRFHLSDLFQGAVLIGGLSFIGVANIPLLN